MKNKGIVSEIQRSSFHDGPGIRTTVFLKGCPLRCAWCHNPESISLEPTVLYYHEKCIGCGGCSEGCYTGARRVVGREMSVDEVISEIMQDAPYFGESGGVTFSGGEPFMQHEFLSSLLDECRKAGIGTALETSMIYYYPEILKKTDIIYADIKLWDPEAHKRYVGATNETILFNIKNADSLGIPIIIHTPLIPDINDDIETIESIRMFAASLKNCIEYRLLPYHPLGVDKARAMGIEQTKFKIPSKERTEELQRYADI